MNINKILKFAKENGYSGAVYLNEWRGYSCYEPTFSDNEEEVAIVGLPLIILCKGDEIRMSTPEEAMKHLDESE